MTPTTQIPLLVAGALLVGAAAFYLGINSDTWLISPDSAVYIEGAQSLVRLQGFVEANGKPISIFPPGTSALYAIPALIPAEGYYFLNLLTKLLALGFIGLTLGVMRRAANLGIAALIGLFLAFSPTLITESTYLLSDVPFAFLLMLLLYLFPAEKLEQMSVKSALALGSLISWCYWTRAIGLAVFVGYAVCIAWRVQKHRMRTLLLVSSVFLFSALVLAGRAHHYHINFSYFQLTLLKRDWELDSGTLSLLDWYERISTNAIVLARLIEHIFTNRSHSGIYGLLIGTLLGLGVMGETRNHRPPLHLLILFFYFSILLLRPGVLPERYLLPITPLLALLIFQGARQLWVWLPSIRARQYLIIVLISLIFMNSYWRHGYAHAKRVWNESGRRAALIEYPGHEAFIELVEHHWHMLRESDSVATMHPRILRHFLPAAIRVTYLPFTHKLDKAFAEIRRANLTYLYCDKQNPDMWIYIEAMIRRYPSQFTVVAENSGAVIYKVVP